MSTPDATRGRLGIRYLARLAWARIRTNRRSTRTYAAVAVAAYLLLMSFATINAMANTMENSARDIIGGDVSVFDRDYDYSMLAAQSDKVSYLDRAASMADDVAAIDGVAGVRPRLSVAAQLESATQIDGGLVIGARPDTTSMPIAEGTWPAAGQICLNPSLASRLDVGVGDRIEASVTGSPLERAVVDLEVACLIDNARFGLFRSTHAVMDLGELQQLIGRDDSITQLVVDFAEGADRAGVQRDIEAAVGESATVEPISQTADLIFTIQRAQAAMMWGLVGITGLIIAAIIGDITAFALRRERGEIAALRAMGFGPGQLRAVTAMQTVAIGTVMAVVGSALAALTVIGLSAVGIPIGEGRQLFGDARMYPVITPVNVLLTVLILVGALVIANTFTTRSILRKTPLELLSDR